MNGIKSDVVGTVVAALMCIGASGSANAYLVEGKFSTGNIGFTTGLPYSVSEQAFLNALSNNSINPSNFGGISGSFFYESTTSGNANTATRNYNGAVDFAVPLIEEADTDQGEVRLNFRGWADF